MSNILKNIHWSLLLSFSGLIAFGALFIFSAAGEGNETIVMRQLTLLSAGFIIMWITSLIGFRFFVGISNLIYALALIFLVCVFIFGVTHSGAKRWLDLGLISIQPSEFAKIATILVLAKFLGERASWEKYRWVAMRAIGLALIPFVMIVQQPDLGTSLLFIPLVLTMLFIWGIRYRYLILSFVLGTVMLPFFWLGLKEYQKKRILVFLNPNLDPLGSGYTAIQSKIAVGSGGIVGKGYLQGTQSQLNFVPEHHTDFIFCVIAEEWGFLGGVVLLLLYGSFFSACFQIMRTTTDMTAKLIISGIVALLFSQVMINIGMTIGIMPITGLTLPFISYGGSSILISCFAIGLVHAIYRERSIF